LGARFCYFLPARAALQLKATLPGGPLVLVCLVNDP